MLQFLVCDAKSQFWKIHVQSRRPKTIFKFNTICEYTTHVKIMHMHNRLFTLKNLHSLYISSYFDVNEILSHIHKFNHLHTLCIMDDTISPINLKPLQRVKSLHTVILYFTHVESFVGLENIHTVKIFNYRHDIDMEPLRNCKHLTLKNAFIKSIPAIFGRSSPSKYIPF